MPTTHSASMHQATPPPAILDIEASGFGLGSYPIEIGFVLSDGSTWCSLVHPEPDWQHWDPEAATVHGIQRAQLVSHGRRPTDLCQLLNDRLRGLTVYSDAWAHDYTWLNRLYEAAGTSPRFKLDNLRALLDESDAAQWHEAKRRVALSAGLQRHRASADARLLQQTWISLKGLHQAAA